MFEVRDRAGMARTGTWTFEGGALATPNVLFAVTPRSPPPPFGDALLSGEDVEDPRPVFRDAGSAFRPRDAPGPLAVPADFAKPAALPDLERPAGPPGLVVVASTPEDVAAHPEAEVVAVADAVGELRSPKRFVSRVVGLRGAMGYARLLYAPGLATPGNLALLAYLGIDLVDSTRVVFESALRRFLTVDGSWGEREVAPEACACPACAGGAGRDLVVHNARALLGESRYVAMAIRAGRLRELAERRSVNDPWSAAALRELDLRFQPWQESHAPVVGGPVYAYSPQSLHRPEVLRFRRRLRERYAKPPSGRVLLLLPCSARKPYGESRTHRRFREAVWRTGNPFAVHEVIVTSPFGLVPRELERMYPAAHYDVPVTGDWSRDEVAVLQEDLRALLERDRYDAVVAHLDTEAPIVREVVGDAAFPCTGRVTDPASLEALAGALAAGLAGVEKVGARDRAREDLRNVAAFQFGPEGAALLEGASLRGRHPNFKVDRGGVQLATFTDQGKLALTLAGGEVLAEAGVHWVEIEDFRPEGSVFAVGVTAADARVRVGDEVAVRHGPEVRAVGVAAMHPREMVDLRRGEAVRVRHRAKKV